MQTRTTPTSAYKNQRTIWNRAKRNTTLRRAWSGVVENLEQRRMLANEPTLNVAGTLTLNEGSSTTLNATASAASGSTISRIEWDNNYNGTTFRPAATGRTFRFNATNNGTRVVAARAIDSQNRVSTVITRTLTIADVAPTITITTPNSADEGQAHTLSWRYSDPGNGGNDLVTGWSIDWGDGNIDNFNSSVPKNTIRSAEHTYTSDGNYNITLTATQQNGPATTTRVMAVAQVNPIVTVSTTDTSIDEGDTATIAFGTTNRNQTISGWSIDWGDGETEFAEVGTEELTHVYNEPGSFSVAVKAIEIDEGNLDPNSNVGVGTVSIAVANLDPEATISSAPSSATAGSTVNFTSNASDPGGLNEGQFTYEWRVTRNGSAYDLNGAAVDGENLSFIPRTPGSYRAKLIVTDPQGGTVEKQSLDFTVDNVDPTAAVTAPGTGTEGQAINASVAVTDPGTNTHTYTWSVTRNNQPYTLPSSVDVDEATFSFTPHQPGNYKVKVVVEDDWDGTGEDETSAISIANVLPTGTVASVPSTGVNEGDVVVATITADDAGSTAELTYEWSLLKDNVAVTLPSGMVTTGSSFTYTPTDNGDWVARVSIYDGVTTVDVDSAAMTVANAVPTVAPTRTNTALLEGQSISLTSGYQDAGSDDTAATASFAWSVTKDAVAVDLTGITTNQSTFSFTPADNGDYVVTVIATDKDSGASTSQSTNFTVGNVAPTAPSISSAAANPNEGDSVTLNFSGSTDVAADTVQYRYRVLQGSTVVTPWTNGNSLNFTYPDNGDFTFEVKAFDEDGTDSDVVTLQRTASNLNPAVTVNTSTATANEGDQLSFTSNVVDVVADTLTYSWSVTRNNQPFTLPSATVTNTATLSFIAPNDGTYEATLTVTDDDTGTDDDKASSAVSNVVPTGTVDGSPTVNINEGDVVVLTSAITDPGTADTLSYSWSLLKDTVAVTLPSGMATTGSSFTFTPTDNGTWKAVLTVTDGDGAPQTFYSADIVVDNVNPTATVTEQTSVRAEGSAITVRANPSDVGADDTVFTYAWTLTKDTVAVDVSALTTNARDFTFTPSDNGNYVASVTVTDDDGGSVVQTRSLAVSNVNPVATINGAPTVRDEAQTVSMTASTTDAGANDVITYAWTVYRNGSTTPYNLQGATANTASFTFTPREPGTYRVAVTATDNDGGTDTKDATVEVRNLNPTVNITGTPLTAINEGTQVTLDAVASDPGGDATLSYQWIVTRNNQPYSLAGNATATTSQLVFAPNDNGNYRVRVEVSDEQDGIGAILSPQFTANNVAPTASITGAPTGQINEGTVVVLNSGVTDPGSADTHTYQWSLTRDGSPVTLPNSVAQAQNLEFVAFNEGNFVATLVVTDKDSASSSVVTSATMTAVNVAPVNGTITPASTNQNKEGTVLTFTGNATDPGSQDTITYDWLVRRVGATPMDLPVATGTGQSFNFTPPDNGQYTVELSPKDDLNWTTVVTQTVTVANVAPTPNIVTSESNLSEGIAFSSTGSFTDVAADATGATYAWTARRTGGGPVLAVGTNSTFDFTPPDNGSFSIELNVTDKDGATGTFSRQYTVANRDPAVTVNADTVNAEEGDTVTFSATATDVAADPLSYSWTVTRNNQPFTLPSSVDTTSDTLTFVVPDDGTYRATATVTDGDGGSDDDVELITVANVAPTATVTMLSEDLEEGTEIEVEANVTDPGSLDTHTYLWSLTKNGIAVNLGSNADVDDDQFKFTPNDEGNYVATVVVTDNNSGEVTVSSSTLEVDNVAPTAQIQASEDNLPMEGERQSFTAVAEDAGSTDTLSYAWTVRIGGDIFATGTGETFEFTPIDDQDANIELVVTDNDGGSTTINGVVELANVAPQPGILRFSNSYAEGVTIEFGSEYDDVPGDTAEEYSWSVRRQGSTTVIASGSASSFDFTPPDNGDYEVMLQITDDDGATGTSVTLIEVANLPPQIISIAMDDETLNQGNTVTFAPDFTELDEVSYAWRLLLDGSPLSGFTSTSAQFSATPTLPGNYSVELTITDTDEASDTFTRDFQVFNIAPDNVQIVGDLSPVSEGSTLSLTASASDPAGPTDLGYIWTVRRGGDIVATQNGIALNYTPDRPGAYNVELTARDSSNAATSVNSNVTVNNVAPTVTWTTTNATTVRPLANIPFGVSWSDPGTGSTVTASYTVNGITTPLGTGVTGSGSFDARFTANGSFPVTVTVNDGTTSTTQTRNLTVSDAFVGQDPTDSTQQAIILSGTSRDDVINIASASNGRIRAFINGVATPIFNSGLRVVVFGHAGADRITVNNDVTVDAYIEGGADNDTITTSSGRDFVNAGSGSDVITTNAGRDIVFGGGGADTIDTGAGEDIAIGSDVAATQSIKRIRDEWNDTTRSFSSRVSRLRAVGTFSDAVINDTTVSTDNAADSIIVGSESDWIVGRGSPADVITGLTTADRSDVL
jgi:PKD repeat protein